MGKFLRDTQYVFTLEPYTDGTPVPTVVTKEVVPLPLSQQLDSFLSGFIFKWAHFLLPKPDFSKTEVVKVYVGTIVTMVYWKPTIEGKKGAQLE
jgi:hypothetical protein